MKKLPPLLALVCSLMTLTAFAEENPVTPPGTGDPKDLTLIKKEKKDPPIDPFMPRKPGIHQYLHVSFCNNMLTVDFPEDAETGIVTISTGTFPVYSGSIDRTNNTLELPELTGEFLLTVNFDNGDDYEGGIAF